MYNSTTENYMQKVRKPFLFHQILNALTFELDLLEFLQGRADPA